MALRLDQQTENSKTASQSRAEQHSPDCFTSVNSSTVPSLTVTSLGCIWHEVKAYALAPYKEAGHMLALKGERVEWRGWAVEEG